MSKTIEEQIERAKELLSVARHASMATVNEDGTPHNTPFMLMYDDTLEHIYWGSHPEAEHSKNILRTGQIFVALYDAVERGGLYIRANDAHQLDGAELDKALAIHNRLREARGQDQLPLSYYVGTSPQRMWSAAIAQLWVNGTKRGEDGHITQDIRTEISATDLL
jgi:hypothetical protein